MEEYKFGDWVSGYKHSQNISVSVQQKTTTPTISHLTTKTTPIRTTPSTNPKLITMLSTSATPELTTISTHKTTTSPQLTTTSLLKTKSAHKTTTTTTTTTTMQTSENSKVTSDIIAEEVLNGKNITGEKSDIDEHQSIEIIYDQEALPIKEREAAKVKTKIYKLIKISPFSPGILCWSASHSSPLSLCPSYSYDCGGCLLEQEKEIQSNSFLLTYSIW